LRIIDDLR